MSKSNRKAVLPIFVLITEYILYLVYTGSILTAGIISDFSDILRIASFILDFAFLIVIMTVRDKEKAFKITAAGCAALYVLNPISAFVILTAYLGIINVDYIFDENKRNDIIRPLFTGCFYLLSTVSYVILRVKRWDYVSAVYTEKNFIIFYVLFALFAVIFTALYFVFRNKEIIITRKAENVMLIIGGVLFAARGYAVIHYVSQRLLSESIMFSIAAVGIILIKFMKSCKMSEDG